MTNKDCFELFYSRSVQEYTFGAENKYTRSPLLCKYELKASGFGLLLAGTDVG